MANINTIKKIIRANIKAQTTGKFIAPLVLFGAPGMGKTSLLKEIAAKNGMSLINQSMAALDSSQLSGIPEFFDEKRFSKYNVLGFQEAKGTIWTIPELIMQANRLAEENENGVILLLDDIHESSMGVQPYLYEMLLERKLGQYKFHDKVAIVATANNSDEANFRGFSSAVINRLQILPMVFDFDHWFKNIAVKFHPWLSSFAKAYPNYVGEPESVELENYGTPRSFEFFNTLLGELGDDEFILQNAETLAAQFMSKNAAKAFALHCAQMSKIDFKGILRKKEMVNISKMDTLDQILFSYIVRYAESAEDGAYLIELLKYNKKNRIFTGIFGATFVHMMHSVEDFSKVNKAHKVILRVLFDLDKDSVGSDENVEKVIDGIKIDAEELSQLQSIVVDFI